MIGSWYPLVRKLVAVIAVLALALAGTVIGLISLSVSSDTSSCVNRVLGARAPSSQHELDALNRFAVSLESLVNADPVDRKKAGAAFVVEVHAFRAQLAGIKADRAKHPLGRC